jgi:hypothetical protein
MLLIRWLFLVDEFSSSLELIEMLIDRRVNGNGG